MLGAKSNPRPPFTGRRRFFDSCSQHRENQANAIAAPRSVLPQILVTQATPAESDTTSVFSVVELTKNARGGVVLGVFIAVKTSLVGPAFYVEDIDGPLAVFAICTYGTDTTPLCLGQPHLTTHCTKSRTGPHGGELGFRTTPRGARTGRRWPRGGGLGARRWRR